MRRGEACPRLVLGHPQASARSRLGMDTTPLPVLSSQLATPRAEGGTELGVRLTLHQRTRAKATWAGARRQGPLSRVGKAVAWG